MNNKLKKLISERFVKVAQDLLNNPEGLKYKLAKAREKLQKDSVKEALGQYFEDLQTFMRMIKAWVSRRYRNVSVQTIVYAVIAVIYFLNPTDFIPDVILGLGFIDDITVISWVLGLIKSDLENFKNWEAAKEKEKEKEKSVKTKKQNKVGEQ